MMLEGLVPLAQGRPVCGEPGCGECSAKVSGLGVRRR